MIRFVASPRHRGSPAARAMGLGPALLFLALVSVSCDPSREVPRSSDGGPTTIRVGVLPNLTHAPALIGREQGSFDAALAPGRIQWHFFAAGPQVVEALFSNELDLAYLGPGPALNGYVRSHGRALRIASGVATGGAALLARAGARWSDPGDLAGRKIATPGYANTQDLALRWWMHTRGLRSVEEGGTVAVIPLPGAEQMNLVRSGELDGAWTVEPWVSRLVHETGARVLMEESELWPKGRYPTTLLVVRPAFAAAHPEIVRRWIMAQEGIMTLIATEPDSARHVVNRELARLNGKGLPDSLLASAFRRLHFSAELPVEALLDGGRRARALGFLPADPPPAESLLVGPLSAVPTDEAAR